MEVVNLKQGSEEWHRWRRSGITATDAAVLLERSPYKTWWQLWAEKTGRAPEPDLENNPLVQKGKNNEDYARKAAEDLVGGMLLPVCGQSREDPLFRASLDGQEAESRPVELKVPTEKTFQDVLANGRDAEVFPIYEAQVQAQLLVTGAESGVLLFFNPEAPDEPVAFTIEWDAETIERIRELGRTFWEKVEKDQPPRKDPERDVFHPDAAAPEVAARWAELASEFLDVNDQIQTLKREMDDLRAQKRSLEASFTDLMGEFRRAEGHGVQITRFQKRGQVDYAKVLRDHAPHLSESELDRYRKAPREEVRTTPVADRKESGAEASRQDKQAIQSLKADETEPDFFL